MSPRPSHSRLSSPAATCLAALLGALAPASAADFTDDVLPIFEEKCFRCHGNGKSKGAVNLDPEHMARIIGEPGSGRAIAAGNATESRLYEVVANHDDDAFMPPPGKGEPLTSRELRTLRAWIESGAPLDEEDGAPDQPAAISPRGELAGEWTNHDGKTIRATLLRVVDDKAVLRLQNGRVYHYPVAQLDDESRRRVEAFAEGKEATRGGDDP